MNVKNDNLLLRADFFIVVISKRVGKHKKMNFLSYQGVFGVENNEFEVRKFQFFTLKYFPIFQDGGHKNIEK